MATSRRLLRGQRTAAPTSGAPAVQVSARSEQNSRRTRIGSEACPTHVINVGTVEHGAVAGVGAIAVAEATPAVAEAAVAPTAPLGRVIAPYMMRDVEPSEADDPEGYRNADSGSESDVENI